MTKHEQAISDFLAANPTWRKNKFRSTLNEELGAEEIEHVSANLGFIPDAYEIDVPNTTVRLLEVDGSSYTKVQKLRRIAVFALELDDRSWFTELHTIHLVTGAKSMLTDADLCRHAFNFICEDAQNKFART